MDDGAIPGLKLPEKVIITASRYNGAHVSIEAKDGQAWHYFRVRINEREVDGVYGYAHPGDVQETLREIARARGEESARYAASHREHMTDLFNYER